MTVAHNSDEWRWADPSGQQRKIRADELRAALASGVIAPNAPVWRPGYAEWQPANTVAELMTSALSAENGVLLNVPPPPLAIVAVQHAYEGETHLAEGGEEPPPPPPYVPLPPKSTPELTPSAPPQAPPPSSVEETFRVSAANNPAAKLIDACATPESDPTLKAPPKPPAVRTGTLIGFAPTAEAGLPPVQSEATDELSASHLIPAESAPDLEPSVPLSANDGSESVHLPFRPSRADQLRVAVKNAEKVAKAKPQMVAMAGGAVLLGLFGIVALSSRGGKAPVSVASVASGGVKTKPSAPVPSCVVLSEGRSIAPHASSQVGIEVVASKDRIGLGFAASPRKAISLSIDPTTFEMVAKAPVEVPRIAHVLPLPMSRGDNRFSTVVDSDLAEAPLTMKRTFLVGDRLEVGVRDKALVIAKSTGDYADMFSLADGEGGVDALRAVPIGNDEGVAVAFRRGGSSIWLGIAMRDAGELKSMGLFRFAGSSAKVGAPSVVALGTEVLVSWADRASPNAPWTVKTGRWGREGLSQPKDFNLPKGGKGEQGMSPALVAVDKRHALLAWTEGPVSSHEVRAQLISLEGEGVGAPLSLSNAAANAGQAQGALLPSGKGLFAFLVERGKELQLNATSISCASE